MFTSLLIANRGEIACRIIHTAKRLGIRTIAVYSEGDACALHVELADEAYLIGPSRAAQSYLDGERILKAVSQSGAAAIHPGYGFLSENADFAAACKKAGVVFVGPPTDAMRLMGRKDEAKALMAERGISVVPGFEGRGRGAKVLAGQAKRLGFPVMIKAVAGGGGRGMRLVQRPADFEAALESARREAKAAFGDGTILIEKAILKPRHIEVQIFADTHGNVVHLFERDCSLQRRHQKVVEEAPAPHMPPALSAAIAESAVEAARAVKYTGAGTVEFLVEGGKLSPESPFYFLEMNTRLQVEHPVTEAITGFDLVEWQLQVAAGEALPAAQADITQMGAAIEARLYAEDPAHDFLPSPGRIYALGWPQGEGVRVDGGVRQGDAISPHYDTLIAKIIAHGPDRKTALKRLLCALEETVIAGPKTNLAFLHTLLEAKPVEEGRYDTAFIESHRMKLLEQKPSRSAIVAGAEAFLTRAAAQTQARGRAFSEEPSGPWSRGDGFRLGSRSGVNCTLLVDGVAHDFDIVWQGSGACARIKGAEKKPIAKPEIAPVAIDAGEAILVLEGLIQVEIKAPETAGTQLNVDGTGGIVKSPLPGRVTKLYVDKDQKVAKGDRIAVLEAMKMEHVLHAPFGGVVEGLEVAQGDQIGQDTVIARIAKTGEGGERP